MNKEGTKQRLPLFGEISMSKNHSLPQEEWREAEDSNSPQHNEALCPLFYTRHEYRNPVVYDRDGHAYTVDNQALYRDDQVVGFVEEKGFTRRATGIKDDMAEYWNGTFYRAEHKENTVIIYRSTDLESWEIDHEYPFSNLAAVHTERLYHGEYYCVETFNANTYLFGKGKFHSVLLQYEKVSPKLFIDDSHGQTVACYCGKTGVVPLEDDSNWHFSNMDIKFFVWNTDTWETATVTCQGTTVIPGTTSTGTINNTAFVARQEQSITQKFCYKNDATGKYYEEPEFINEVTFDVGFTPTQQQGNMYKYTEYTVTYTYTSAIAAGVPESSDPTVATVHWNINLTDLTVPAIREPRTYSFSTVNDGSSHTLTFVNNYGFVSSRDFWNTSPTVTMTTGNEAVGSGTIPASAVGYSNNGTPGHSMTPVAIPYRFVTNTTTVSANAASTYLMLDDGMFYGIHYNINDNGVTFKGYNFKNSWVSYSNTVITVTPVRSDLRWLNTYRRMRSEVLTVGYGHLRTVILNTASAGSTINASLDGCVAVMYDSIADLAVNDTGVTSLNGMTTSRLDTNAPYVVSPAGTRGNSTAFNMLVNNGFVSGVSYNGTLLTAWYTVDSETPIYMDDTCCFYRDVNTSEWIFIEAKEQPVQLSLIEDRYLVANTTGYLNCYDTRLAKMCKYADDWNQRIFVGAYRSNDPGGDWALTLGSGRNVNYALTGMNSGIASAIMPPATLLTTNNIFIFITDEPLPVELYWGFTAGSVPKYFCTCANIKAGSCLAYFISNTIPTSTVDMLVNGTLQYYEAVYPVQSGYTMMNPSLFARYVYSGNNQDYYIDGNVGHAVLYDSTQPVLLSDQSGDVYGMEAIFVIQSTPYAIIDGKIYGMSYTATGKFNGMLCIINAKGMKYIGAVPSKAFFWSPNNRAIYIFTGDANFTKVKDASAISSINDTWYNPATQTIYLATDVGLYMLSDQSSYRQPFLNVASVTFISDGSSVIVDGTTAYRMYYEDAEGRTTNQVKYDSGLLGAGNHKIWSMDKLNICLFSDQRRNGKITVVTYTLTDTGEIQEETTSVAISTTNWDKQFNCTQVDVTPVKHIGVGIGVRVVSDFAITDMTASCRVLDTTQSAVPKFKI